MKIECTLKSFEFAMFYNNSVVVLDKLYIFKIFMAPPTSRCYTPFTAHICMFFVYKLKALFSEMGPAEIRFFR
jgi:hypothetical protein